MDDQVLVERNNQLIEKFLQGELYIENEKYTCMTYKDKFVVMDNDGGVYIKNKIPEDIGKYKFLKWRGKSLTKMVESFKGRAVELKHKFVWYYFDDEHVYSGYKTRSGKAHKEKLEELLSEIYNYLSGIPEDLNQAEIEKFKSLELL